MSQKEENNIIHIINTLRDEMKTVNSALRDEMRSIREEIRWLIGTMVIVSIAIVGGMGWIHNHHLKKDNTMSVDIVKNEKEIQEVKAEVKALAQK